MDTEGYRGTQGNTEGHRGIQGNTGRHRGYKRYRETQGIQKDTR